jgi:hypothetical protein
MGIDFWTASLDSLVILVTVGLPVDSEIDVSTRNGSTRVFINSRDLNVVVLVNVVTSSPTRLSPKRHLVGLDNPNTVKVLRCHSGIVPIKV